MCVPHHVPAAVYAFRQWYPSLLWLSMPYLSRYCAAMTATYVHHQSYQVSSDPVLILYAILVSPFLFSVGHGVQVVGVVQAQSAARLFKLFWCQSFQRGLCSNGHKHRQLNRSMGKLQRRCSGFSRLRAFESAKSDNRREHCAHRASRCQTVGQGGR